MDSNMVLLILYQTQATNVHEYDKFKSNGNYIQKYQLKIDQLTKERLKTSKLHWGRRHLQRVFLIF